MAGLNAFVQSHPDAVFVQSYPYRTFRSIREDRGFYRGGYESARDLLTGEGAGEREILLKPNVTIGCPTDLRRQRSYHGGIVTNAQFIGGILDRLIELGETRMAVVEKSMRVFSENGYVDMIGEERQVNGHMRAREDSGARISWTARPRFEDYRGDELTWVPVKDGVVHRTFPIDSPSCKPGTILMNVPTLKTHNLGVTTLCCKNLQGIVAQGYKHFCTFLDGFDDPKQHPPGMVEQHLQPGFQKQVLEYYRRHVAMGLPMWETNQDEHWQVGRFEPWAQRISDLVSIFRPYEKHFLINIVEGIIGRDGTAFNQGEDRPVGLVIAGVNPVHVDAVASFLAGHDPRYIPFMVIAHERGLGEKDIERIEIYEMAEQRPLTVEALRELIVPLPVYLHGDATRDVFFNESYFEQNNIPCFKP